MKTILYIAMKQRNWRRKMLSDVITDQIDQYYKKLMPDERLVMFMCRSTWEEMRLKLSEEDYPQTIQAVTHSPLMSQNSMVIKLRNGDVINQQDTIGRLFWYGSSNTLTKTWPNWIFYGSVLVFLDTKLAHSRLGFADYSLADQKSMSNKVQKAPGTVKGRRP